MYSLFFVFFFLCHCFWFLSCFYVLKNKKFFNSRLIIGGQKRGFSTHSNYWGRVPGLPPRVYAYDDVASVVESLDPPLGRRLCLRHRVKGICTGIEKQRSRERQTDRLLCNRTVDDDNNDDNNNDDNNHNNHMY